ncbi:MAG TPA: PQQ-binding-like beta-propeller repeat protein [Pyrinomonadaceae bacterium]|jgi:outer membrane protein assembly factor BamB|nr:PQQ-binding-like beta-propeller repeat protein [Pyrinomonadaceae bacterium]
MFDETQPRTKTPWYFTRPVMLAAPVLVVVLVGVGVYLLFGTGHASDPGTEAHYAELERQRAEQRASAPSTDAPAAAVDPQASQPADPNAQPAAPGTAPADPATAAQAAGAAPAPVAGQPTAAAAPARRNYWTNFRGPSRDGRYDEQPIRTNWQGGLQQLWKQPSGGGYSSFSVADGVAFTIEQRRGQEVVAAYQVETGRELWTHAWDALYTDSTGDGPRSTPTWNEGRLYALGALGELRCLDARSGKLIWSKNILKENGASNNQWGMAASPLVVDDKVVVIPGGANGKSVVAYNAKTGERVWGALGDAASYTSPMLVTLAGRRQILAVTARRVAGIAPEDGSVLWEYPWSNSIGINVAQPIVVNANRFFISAGYGKGAALVELTDAGGKLSAASVWEKASMKNKFNSSVLHEGYVYGLDEGMLTCVDVATGEQKWKARGYGYGQVVLASGHLIVTTEEGEIALVRATPAGHTELARFPALEGRTWNCPAIANGRLLVRNATQMACYKLSD